MMLNNLRDASQSWGMRAFLGLVTVVFIVFWTAGDSLNWRSMGASQTVATVGGKKILLKEFFNDVKRRAIQHKYNTGADPDMRFIVQGTLEEQIAHKLIELEAEKQGLVISDEQVRQAIRANKEFQDDQGVFNKGLYKEFLRLSGYQEIEFVSALRNEMRRHQLIRAMVLGTPAVDSMVRSFIQWNFEKRVIRIADLKYKELDRKDLGQITKDEIKAYYDAHHEAFTVPESRDFSVILLSPEQFKARVTLTDEQTQAGFNSYLASRKGQVPTKQESDELIHQLKSEIAEEKVLELSDKIQDEIAGGASLDEIAKNHHLSVVKVPGVQRDTKSVQSMNTDQLLFLIQDGFAAVKGDSPTTHELKGGRYMFIQLEDVHLPKLRPLEAVEGEAEAKVLLAKQKQLMAKKAEHIVHQVKQGKSLDDFSKTRSYTISKDSHQQEIPLMLRRHIFGARVGDAVFVSGEHGYLVAQVEKVIPADQETVHKNVEKFSVVIKSLLSEDIMSVLLGYLEGKYKIERNTRVIDKVMRS